MKAIQKIIIEHTPDYDADLSWIGTFNDDPSGEFTIEHTSGGRNSYKYFHPQVGACENMEQARKDYNRLLAYDRNEWGMIGIKARAIIETWQPPNTWKKLDTITSGGLWGIEDDQGDEDYKDIENDQLEELKTTLRELGFTNEQINSATVELKK